MIERAQYETLLQAERLTGLGGTDIHQLMNLEPWGCRRRVWYQKRNVPPDYEDEVRPEMERGLALQEMVIDRYVKETGCKRDGLFNQVAENPVTGLHRHAKQKHLIVHVDEIVEDARGPKVLEAKTVGARMYWMIKREGLPDAYNLQLQHAMLVTKYDRGAFALLWPDGWRMLQFDVPANKKVQAVIESEAEDFWKDLTTLGPEPERLAPTDPRCGSCAWRSSCQGKAMLEALREEGGAPIMDAQLSAMLKPILKRFWDVRSLAKESAEMYEAAKEEMKAALGNLKYVETQDDKIHFRPLVSNRIDPAKLRKHYPDVAAECTVESVSRPLKVFAK